MSKTLADDLRAARALIDTPEKWGKAKGSGLCVLQACNRATGFDPKAAMNALEHELGVDGLRKVIQWNDDPATIHADIMALFDRAIATAETSP